MLKTGLYEQVINQLMAAELAQTDKFPQSAPLDAAESAKVLAKYLAEIIENSLDRYKDGGSLADQILLVNKLVAWLKQETQEPGLAEFAVPQPGKQLLALLPLIAVRKRVAVFRARQVKGETFVTSIQSFILLMSGQCLALAACGVWTQYEIF